MRYEMSKWSAGNGIHSVHWSIKKKKKHPPLFLQAPPSLSKLPFLGNSPLYIGFW